LRKVFQIKYKKERNMNTAAEIESAADIFIETLKAIEEGLQDIKEGRVVKFEDFLKKYGYEI